MTQFANTFEGGTNGTTITTGNSGGTSGSAFDAVTIGTSGTLTFDNTHAAHGSLAMKVQQGATGATTYGEKNFAGFTSSVAVRFYLYVTSNPGTSSALVIVASGAGGTIRGRVRLSTTGKLQIIDSAGTAVADALLTTSVPLNAWCRVEAQFTLSTTVGQVTLARYDTADSAVATETVTSAASKNFGGTADRVRWGLPATVSSVGPLWIDDLAQNDTGTAIGSALLTYTGTAAQTLPSFTQSAAGTVTKPTYTATSAQALPSFTQSAAGTVTQPVYTATSAQTLPSFSQSASGTVTQPVYTGTAAQSLPAFTQTATGTVTQPVYTGSSAQTLPAFTQQATGTSTPPTFTGTAVQTLPAFGQAATGTVTAPTYTATAATILPSFTQTATGTFTGNVYTATAAQALPGFTQAATGTTFVATPTPTDRTYLVSPDLRTYAVDADPRAYTVEAEIRHVLIPAEARVDLIPAEARVLEVT